VIARADAVRLPFADQTFDLVMGSPPYVDARLYLEDGRNLGISRDCREWVEWMLAVTTEALRVSRGLVLWVCAGVTRDWNYQPAPEGLLYRWWERGGECHCLRPVYWHRVGIPGSGGEQWFRADVEYVLAFKRPGQLPWADPLANGHPPKWAPGGEMSHRRNDGMQCNGRFGGIDRGGGPGNLNPDGTRDNRVRPSHKNAHGVRIDKPVGTRQYGHREERETETYRATNRAMRQPNGLREDQAYESPILANPGCLVHTNVGGGQLGHKLAHENEAPFPEDLAAWFIASHAKPGGSVFDPFLGSGTTAAAALSLGRKGFGCDLRQSQCRLARRRIGTVTPGFTFAE
jgi:hypothetical protein